MSSKESAAPRRRHSSKGETSSQDQLNPSGARYAIARHLEDPRFDIDGRSTYGDFSIGSKPPGNRHFIPRRAKLRAAGGKSISLYEKWRMMQFQTNCIMKRFLDKHRVNVSVLPPCVHYDLWKHPKWKAEYEKPLDEDPCPDCDVRFTANSEGIYKAKIAPASILVPTRWRKRTYLDTIILIGLPQHITVAYIRETTTQVYVEYVDPGRKVFCSLKHRFTGPCSFVEEIRKKLQEIIFSATIRRN
ncbi:unnamed protein product [Clavelina lepadiformis]|uniref:Uncharacterized protein n=1 Tax=Clavelina lepadiformis TaxID=159417 RepID=A0ABP0EY90_CLALP